MADIEYGGSAGDWRQAIRAAQEQGRATEDMTRKEEERRRAEERAAPTQRSSASTRDQLSQSTAELTGRLTASTEAIRAETAALGANIAMMERSLVLRRQLAATPVVTQAARAEATAAASTAPTAAQEAERMAAINRADQLARAEAEAQAAANASRAVEMARAARRQLSPASFIEAGPIGSTGPERLDLSRLPPPGTRPRYMYPWEQSRPPAFGYTTGGPAEAYDPTHKLGTSDEGLQRVRSQAQSNARALEAMGAEQMHVNQAFAQANALYSDSSTRLSRHGALTTEFIQSLARGQVTLHEFGEQMTSVIGKFGGWLIAGAAVYGVYDMFKHLTEGATESQAAIQNLGRFLPGLGGPAGGGSGQIGAAYGAVRGLSTQFNLPVSQVADPAQIMARLFGGGPNPLGNTVSATQAVLAASRLDQVDPNTAAQYLTGIGQSFGFLGGAHAGDQMIGVINSLNALQSRLGARVAQTLPAVARAAPAALTGGLAPDQLEALASLGVRAGLPGAQVGTALLRSVGTFAWRPQSLQMFREYGLNPQIGSYGDLVSQLFSTIDRRARETGPGGPRGQGPLSGTDLRNLAIALGGPLLGARSILPLLAAEQEHPGTYSQALDIARHPRPYQEDLGAVLSTVPERFKSIGIALENFGSQLAQAGLLTPLTGMLDAANVATHALEGLVSPLASLLSVVNQLPGPVRDALGVFLAFRAARFLLDTRFGSGAQQFLGRLPGLEVLRNQPREGVEGIRANLQREILPADERRVEDAARRYREAESQRTAAFTDFRRYSRTAPSESLPADDPRMMAYSKGLTERRQAYTSASDTAASALADFTKAAEQSAKTESLIALSRDKQYSWAERASILEQEGYVALSATVDRTKELAAVYDARIAAMRRGGGAAAAGTGAAPTSGGAGRGFEEAAFTAAAATTVVGAAATEFAQNTSAQQTIRRGLESSGIIPVAGQTRPVGPFEPAQAPRPTPPETTQPLGEGRIQVIPGGSQLDAIGERVAQRLDPLTSRVGEAGGVLPFVRQTAGGIATSPAGPFAALLATQMLGSALPGGVGSYVSNVGGQAATGALIAQMLGRGGTAGILAGATIGTVAGGFSQNTGSGLGALAGGAVGAALGSIIPGGGTAIGGLIGSQVGGFIGNLIGGGGPQSQQDQQNQAQRQALSALRAAGVPGLPNLGGLPGDGDFGQAHVTGTGSAFGNQLAGNLATAFLGSGASAQRAQQGLQQQIPSLQGIVSLFGTTTRQGRAASGLLTDVITSAVAESGVDPQVAYQLIQAATQTKSKPISDAFTYNLAQQSGVVTGDQGAAAQAAQQYQAQVVGPFYQGFTDAQQELNGAQSRMSAALKSGSQKTIDAARTGLRQAQDQYDSARGAYTLAQQAGTVAEQQFYQQQYQASAQYIQAQTHLGQAQAGGRVSGQLQAQLVGAQQTVDTLKTYGPGKLGRQQYATQMAEARAQLDQVQTQIAQQGLTELTAQGAVAVSRTPLGDPIAQARAQYKSYLNQLHYMQQHRKAFDPSQINDMLAQVNDAWKNIAQQVQDYDTQMIGIRTQLAQAEHYGDAVQQAADAVHGAQQQRAVARTPQARAQAQAQYAQAIAQQQQAQVARIQSEGQLASAQAWGDPAAQAAALQQAAQRELAIAHGRDQVIQAELALAQAQQQGHQAVMQLIQAQGQLAQATASGDVVAQAQAAQQTARQELAAAHGQLEVLQAEAQLRQANFQYQQALADRAIAVSQLAASETVNPVTALYRQLQGVRSALSVTTAPDPRRQLQTQLNSLTHQWEQATIDQRSSIVDFQFQMMQITAQQAVQQLTSLTHLKGITLAQRQQLLEQIRRYQLGEVSPIGSSGQFDLAPGNIKLPTYYDVGHAIRARPAFTGVGVSNANQINVYVGKDADIAKVADVLDRATGGNLRGRLRAAGVR